MSASLPLSQQLAWTARAVLAVEQGRSLTDALVQVPGPVRPGVQALAFHALRHWGQARVLTEALAQRPPEPRVRVLLGVALTLLLPDAQSSENVRYEPHTVVDQAVQALATWRVPTATSGFLNACLRRFLREQEAMLTRAEADAMARWNHPFWWVQRVRRDHPQHWQELLQANNRPAPMVLRVNRRKRSQDDYLRDLAASGVPALPVGRDGVELLAAQPVEHLPGWAEGLVSVQDGAAQVAAPCLLDGAGLPPGARVLDACAAPGGKTAHLLECADLDVLALDVDATRCQRIHENLQRLGLKAEVKVADAADTAAWWDGCPFAAILLDAPCTASGIVRRHPDVRWLRRPEDILQLAQQQARLLEALWPLLQPGGRLLYCTCSVFKAEGDEQVRAFLSRHADASTLPAPGHMLTGKMVQECDTASAPLAMGDNGSRGTDGFFYALLRKSQPA